MKTDEQAQKYLSLGHNYFCDEPRDVEAVVREFRQVVELEPSWDEGYGWLSAALQELGQIDEAISARREAMRLAPDDARHPTSLGVILMQQHEYSEAIEMLRKGISLNPHYGEADAHLFLAEALLADGQIEEACKEWRFVLTLEPMYPSYKEPHKEAKRMLKKHGGKAS